MPEPWLIENGPIVPEARRNGGFENHARTHESLYVNQLIPVKLRYPGSSP
jgi:hypothetical protein